MVFFNLWDEVIFILNTSDHATKFAKQFGIEKSRVSFRRRQFQIYFLKKCEISSTFHWPIYKYASLGFNRLNQLNEICKDPASRLSFAKSVA